MARWEDKIQKIASNPQTAVTLTFAPRLGDAKDFHERVAAMGVQICTESAAGVLAGSQPLPYAEIAGDVHQPCLIFFWRVAPAAKASIQFRPTKGLLTVKTRRGVLSGKVQLFLTFFGGVVDITGSAPRRSTRGPKEADYDLLQVLEGAVQ